MTELNFKNRTLYHGDNLDFLRGMNSETVHLIATDPPFKKQRDFHDKKGAFSDKWSWDKDVHPDWMDSLFDDWRTVYEVIDAANHAYGQDMGAFLCFMAVRLIEMHRILRLDGSLYLHIDHTARDWVKCLLDAVFGRKMFRSAIIWERNDGRGKGSQHSPKTWGVQTDTLLFYAKTGATRLHPYIPLTADEEKTEFPKVDLKGRYYKTGTPIFRSKSMGARPNLCFEWRGYVNPHPSGWRLSKERLEEEYQKGNVVIRPDGKLERRKYADDYKGRPVGDLWKGIHPAKGKERTDYPTQKPLALYERIIKASSNKGDIVLDPFCGCATTCVAAEKLGRQWVGMDRWPKAPDVILERLEETGLYAADLESARQLGLLHKGDITLETTPPRRTDANEETLPYLKLKTPIPKEPWEKLNTKQIRALLERAQGQGDKVVCGGCGRALESAFMEVDHITPRVDGGLNSVVNRILLCSPCNRSKGGTRTLHGLRRANKKSGWMHYEKEAKDAQQWAGDMAHRVRAEWNSTEVQSMIKGGH